jgi:hypothetical protein
MSSTVIVIGLLPDLKNGNDVFLRDSVSWISRELSGVVPCSIIRTKENTLKV